MIDLPVHSKIASADEDEWLHDLMDEVNECYMAHREWVRKGIKKDEATNLTAEGQHLRKEIVDVLLVSFGYLMRHSESREDAENFILRVILDNKKRGKYSRETEAEIEMEIIKQKELIPNIKAIFDNLRA